MKERYHIETCSAVVDMADNRITAVAVLPINNTFYLCKLDRCGDNRNMKKTTEKLTVSTCL